MQELLAENKKLNSLVVDLQSKIEQQEQSIKFLYDSIRYLKLQKYGRKSEKLNLEDLQAKLFELPEPEPEPESPSEEDTVLVPAHKRARAKRGKSLDDLPVIEEIIEPAETSCPCCQKELVTIGQEETRTLEYEPAKLYVKKTIRPKKACNNCKGSAVVIAPSNSLIPGSFASTSLVVQLMIAKYQDCLPLYRQEKIFERLGYKLERKLTCDWIQTVAESYLYRISQAIKVNLLLCDYLHGDETHVDVLDRDNPKNIKRGYLWGMLGPPGVYFEYSPSRSQDSANSLFGQYAGVLQTDLYVGYNKLNCQRLACLAHIRRKFIESPDCAEKTKLLKIIADLYHQEGKAKDKQDLTRIRQEKSVASLTRLKFELETVKQKFTPESAIVKAASYALKQWDDVLRIMQNPEYQLDNNPIERQMRPIALGRKNWLFAGSHRGAKNAATIFTILNSCKIAGINPVLYLTDVLNRIQDYNVNQISQLTPANWEAQK